MCGIAGIFQYQSLQAVSADLLERMTSRLVHRGPDQSGSFIDAELGLGHRRLSIIDLSEAGRQPMTNEDGSVVVTYNGEIYNFQQLGRELREAGHVFRSASDTEVLVHLWEDHGPAMLDRLEGMYAFALFDRRTRQLFLARDRLGEKPLFWAPTPGGMAFASEMKALFEAPGVNFKADPQRIAEYLVRQYVLAPSTIYQGVHALEPATFGIFGAGRDPRFDRYWRPCPRRDLPRSRPEREALVEDELDRVVNSRTVADVPVGCFLSSGIDSSLVAYGMQHGRIGERGRVETFSIGFDERGYDEARDSTQLARALGVEHHVEVVQPPSFEDMQSILQRYDQPFGDSAAIPTYFLSAVARQRVKVVLTGDGGDEAFGGYERYRLMRFAQTLPRGEWWRRMGRALVARGGRSHSRRRIVGRGLVVAGSPRTDAYVSLMASFPPGEAAALLPDDGVAFAMEQACFDDVRDVGLAAQIADLSTYLPSCLTTKVDVASMAHSLETRAPFLDHRLIELGLGLPGPERCGILRTKTTLRRIAGRRVGPEVAARAKRGFGVPLEIWLRGRLREETEAYLLGDEARASRLLNPNSVRDEVNRFFAGDRARYTRVWTLIALEAWLRGPMGRLALP